ncbi:hypothetical protein IJI79_02610 [Candidatus Saccharibacteria bacterium]|nr:hypothetical protein [Candidatus Saccharibacteria bacterium]
MVGNLAAVEQSATKAVSAVKANTAEDVAKSGGLYNASKPETGESSEGKKFKIPGALKAMLPMLIVMGMIFAIIGLVIALPMMMIGAIDYNLQKALGFTDTVGLLETQGEYITAEMAANGKVPEGYASDLAEHGVDVGQITATGEFYKTNVYIANIEEKEGMVAAAGGFSYVSDEEGELAMLYDGEIIRASEFVAAVESNPRLYAAYSGAADLAAKYYYGKDVSDAYDSMGLSRGNFNGWEQTGDYATDEASFVAILNGVLDNSTDTIVGGARDDEKPFGWPASLIYRRMSSWWTKVVGDEGEDEDDEGAEGTFEEDISTGEASEITATVAEKTKGYIIDWVKSEECEEPTYDEKGVQTGTRIFKCQYGVYDDTQTKRAAELLNSAVSAKEPYTAANTFLAIEEPIQRARIGDNGPVNELMNTISTPTTVSYENVYTGEIETKSLSILETINFQAAVGEKNYSKEEAANFSRDRVLYNTDQVDKDIINSTVVTSNGGQKSESAVRNGKGDSADAEVISKANNSISLAISEKNSSVFRSVIGANRLLEGGSFINNSLNRKAIGAMPSNEEAILAYQMEVDKAVARKEEAERATLSPFDISSPNTFLGSIMHNLATAMLGSYSSSGSLLSAVQSTGSVTGDAVANILGTAKAENVNQKFTTMSQDICATISTVEVLGDLFCTSHNTVATDYIGWTMGDWKGSEIGDSIGDDGEILEGSDLEKFGILGADREATVGVSSAEVCEAVGNLEGGILDKLLKYFKDVIGLYRTCKGVGVEVATGANYTFSGTEAQDENLGLYSGYMLYNQVYSLLSDTDSSMAVVRERYYSKYPKDNSEAGVIARRSGMTKDEAELALAYADYLNEIASYDPAERYHFGFEDLGLGTDTISLKVHSDKMAGDYVAWYMKEIEYEDLRELTTCA